MPHARSVELRRIEDLKSSTQRADTPLGSTTFDEATNTIEVVWYAFTPVDRYSYDIGEFELSFDPGGCDLSRYNAGAAVLKDHVARSDNQVGKIVEGSARIEAGLGKATVKFSRDPVHAGFVGDVQDGIKKNLSMGVEIIDFIELSRAGVAGAERTRVLATQWAPFELSFTPVQADPRAQTLSHLPEEKKAMTEAEIAQMKLDAAKAAKADEAQRQSQIRGMGKLISNVGGDGAAFVAALADDPQCDVATAREKVMAEAERLSNQHPTRTGGRVDPGTDHDAEAGKAMVLAFARRMGVPAHYLEKKYGVNRTLLDRAEEMQYGLDFARLTEQRLLREGVTRASYMSRDQLIDEMTDGFSERSSAALRRWNRTYDRRTGLGEVATSDLPVIASGAQRIAFVYGYDMAPSTCEAWTGFQAMDDYRETKIVDTSNFPELREIGESGKPEYGSVVESAEKLSLKDWGRVLGWLRKLYINSQIDIAGRVAQSVGARVRTLKNQLCYKLLGGTPRLSGSGGLVYTGGNLVATGAPSITTLDALGQAIVSGGRLKADAGADEDYFGHPMVVVVAPFGLRTKIDQLLGANASTYVPNETVGNTTGPRPSWLSGITPVVDIELDRQQGNGVSFYGFANPALHPSFIRTELAGEGVSMQMVTDPETRGTKLIVFCTFNVQATSRLGTAKVAAS